MSGNFIVFRSFVYIPGALIRSSENNTNENTIYGGHNGAFNEITGHEHTGAPGDGPLLGPASINTAANYTWTGIHNFNNTANLNFGGTINNYTITASTLITPTIADFTNAQHNHQNPAGGGALDAAAIAAGILPVVRGGTGVAVSTGTVAVVLSNTPTLITPVIADFTNAQHDHQSAAGGGTLNAAAIAAGILPVVRGGTGVATSTGTTNVVLSNSPTIVTPTIADFTNAQHNHQNAAGGGTLDINLATTGILSITRGGTGAAVVPGANQIIYSDGSAFVGNANFTYNQAAGQVRLISPAGGYLRVQNSASDATLDILSTAGGTPYAEITLREPSLTDCRIRSTTGEATIEKGSTIIKLSDASDYIEYASHSSTGGYGTCRIYTGTLSGNFGVGGSLLNFVIANSQWMTCELKLSIAHNVGGTPVNNCYVLNFIVYRTGAGVKGVGGTAGGDGVTRANTIFPFGGNNQVFSVFEPVQLTSPTGVPFTPDNTVCIHGPDMSIALGNTACNAGVLPVTLVNGSINYSTIVISDPGGDLVNIAIVPNGAPAPNNFRIAAKLETILNEYV